MRPVAYHLRKGILKIQFNFAVNIFTFYDFALSFYEIPYVLWRLKNMMKNIIMCL